MNKFISSLLGLLAALFMATYTQAQDNPKVELKTDLGSIIIELYPRKAPLTVQNFLQYVDSNFYDGTIFHRVVPGFVVQGGGMTFDFNEKPTNPAVKNESLNGLPNDYQSVAMARHSDPDSATSQFYININNNSGLNAKGNKPGYTVFGKVIAGMEVAEKIAQEPRGMFKAHPEAPNYAVRILSAKRYTGSSVSQASTTSPMSNSRIKDALVKPQ